jgi:hypothetical protein
MGHSRVATLSAAGRRASAGMGVRTHEERKDGKNGQREWAGVLPTMEM